MKKLLLLVTSVGLAIVAATVWLHAAAPTIGTTAAAPAYIVINTPTPVVITAQIADPRVIANGVNLLKVDATGKVLSTVGVMHDDGVNGDAIARNQIFSFRLTANEPAVGKAYYQVSAPFTGVLKRTLSTSIVVTIDPFALPPDPGEAGKLTLAGIDSDHDGVRDDVQRWIGLNYASSSRMRSALSQDAAAFGRLLVLADNGQDLGAAQRDLIAAVRCLAYSGGSKNLTRNDALITAFYLNTVDRTRAYFKASSGSYPTSDDPDDLKTFCVVDPDSLN